MYTRLKKFVILLAVSMLVTGTVTPAMAVSSGIHSFEDKLEVAIPAAVYEQQYVPGEILVKFSPGVSESKITALNAAHGASVTYTSPYAGFKVLKVPGTKSVEEMAEIYSKNPNVEYATPNYVMSAAIEPDDTYYSYQWNFKQGSGINVEQAWDISTGTGAVVAVLDTGVAYEDYGRKYAIAPDLVGTSFIPGRDFVNNDDHANDDNGHGTHVAGTIAQATNNGMGVAGVAFDCTVMPVKVLDRSGRGTLQYLLDGIYYATDNGADVISMSLGFDPGVNPDGLEEAVNYAYDHGVTVVAAAGNDELGTVGYPAAYENCIAVGATRFDGNRAYYSNYGTALDIMAPGGDVTVDQNGDGYGDGILQQTFDFNPTDFGYWFYQGTSMATPHVSGVAALLIANGVTDPDDIRTAMQETAQDIYAPGRDDDSGYGIVDAYAALNYYASTPTPNEPPVAVMTFDPVSPVAGETVTFSASLSTDDEGIVLYSWDFGDGSATVTGITAEHTYEYGTYTAILTVTDTEGETGTDSETVTVAEPPAPGTLDVSVAVHTDTKIAGKNTFVYGTATVTVNSGGSPASGATVSGHWTDATTDSDIGITNTNGIATMVSDSVKDKGNTLTFTFIVDSVNISGVNYDVSESGTANYQ